VARKLGVGVFYVTLLPIDGQVAAARTYSAAYRARDADVSALVAGLEADAKVSFAGMLAQARYRATKSRGGWDDDIENARSCAAKIVLLLDGMKLPEGEITLTPTQFTEANAVLERLHEEADTLVEESWPAIERVAEALLARRALFPNEVDALIAGMPMWLA
jgi:hypothetical protein